MCISLEKLKTHSVFIVWLLAMVVFSFLFWFTITPLLFPYSGKKGKKLSQTYIPEFGLIALAIWITFVMACWCCFRKLIREKEDRGESSRLIVNPEDPEFKNKLNGSVKKRLGLLTPDDLVGSSKLAADEGKIEVSVESKGEELSLEEVKVEDQNKGEEGDKPKKRGLISRLSSMRRDKTESDEPEMKIISLPDFSENSFKMLMPHECEHCYPQERRSPPIAETGDGCQECGKVHHSTESKFRLPWNSRKRKDLSVDVVEDESTDEYPTSAFSNETATPGAGDSGTEDYPPGKEVNDEIEPEEEESSKKERKSLKKTESLFLLQALHDKKSSKSEIFLVVNDFGRLVDEPAELAELHGFKN